MRSHGLRIARKQAAATIQSLNQLPPFFASSIGDALELKCRRRIDPQNQRFFLSRILPAMRVVAFKIETVAFLQEMPFAIGQRNFQRAFQNVQEFLAVVRIRFAAAGRQARCGTGAAPSAYCPMPAIPCARRDRHRALCGPRAAPARDWNSKDQRAREYSCDKSARYAAK